jgi:D-alanyl-D-alanine carboxypeptidase
MGSFGCAVHRPLTKTETAQNLPSPPPLAEDQLLGFQRPPNLLKDDQSQKSAQREVIEAYWKLRDFAKDQGWRLTLISGYRSFYAQRQVWNRFDKKYTKDGTLTEKNRVRAVMSQVSVPGLSRHHWGTDLDISEVSLRGKLATLDEHTPQKVVDFYGWMAENAPRFGFCKVYEGNRGAVMNEPWHWSYTPFSDVYEKQFLAIRDFHRILNDKVEDIDYVMKNLPKIIKKELGSVSPHCHSGN